MNATELEVGIELDRLVAQACGLLDRLYDGELLLIDQNGTVNQFRPTVNADDTLYAMDCLRKKNEGDIRIYFYENGKFEAIVDMGDIPHGIADTFQLAVSRAIAQVKP